MKKLVLFALLFVVVQQVKGQYQDRYWHFGYNVCLDFSGGEPVYLPGSAMQSKEGCATQCDAAGNLLFYSNGETVYNKLNQVMDNGDSIGGHNSSAQSVVIVPDPGNPDEYYLFTTDAYEHQYQNGLCWSKVNMNYNNGLGKVTTKKNLILNSGVREGLCAVKRPGCLGYWVLTYIEPKEYIVLEVGYDNIGQTNHYNVGLESDNQLNQNANFLRIDNKSEIIVRSFAYDSKIEILRFDLIEGTIFNPKIIHIQNVTMISGIAFNKNNKLIVATNYPNIVYTFDFTIVADSIIVTNKDSASLLIVPRQIARAKNNKIYIAQHHKYHIGMFQFEDSLYTNCIIDTAVILNTKCKLGLPNEVVIPSPQYYPPTASFSADVLKICPDSCIAFKNNSCDAYAFEWFFEGGVPSYSTEKNPQNICYPESGNYGVMLVAHHGSYSDTAYMPGLIQVYSTPEFSIVQSWDTLFCSNPSVSFSYQWYLNGNIISGANGSFYIATQNGTYALEVTNAQTCEATQSLMVTGVGMETMEQHCDVRVIQGGGFVLLQNESLHNAQFRLTDVSGRVLEEGRILPGARTTVMLYDAGVNFLQLVCGDKREVVKVVR